jgi:hypothetical protein
MTFENDAWLILLSLAMLGSAQAQHLTKADLEARKERIAATYQADKTACKQHTGNAADVCKAEAKARKKVAEAELDLANSGRADDRTRMLEVKAKTAYDVAEEKCDDQAGQAKDLCQREAKSARDKALADARMDKEIRHSREHADEHKMDADHKLAAEKCDALRGTSKSECLQAADRQFGRH